MTDHENVLLHYWAVLRRRAGLLAAAMASLVLVVGIVSMLSTKYYVALATIEISPRAPYVFQGAEVTKMGPTLSWGESVDSYYMTQYQILTSRAVLEEAVRRIREEHGITDFDGAANPTALLRSMVTVVPRHGTHLVDLTAENPDPKKAELFADMVAESYRDHNLNQSRQSTLDALAWLVEQQEHYREQKRVSDEKLLAYQKSNHLLEVDEDEPRNQVELARMQFSYSEAKAERVRLAAKMEELEEMTRRGEWITLARYLSGSDAVMQNELRNYNELEARYDEMTARWKDGHPEVAQVKRSLAAAEDRIETQVGVEMGARRAELKLLENEEAELAREIERSEDALSVVSGKLIELEFLRSEADRNNQFFRDLDERRTEVSLAQFLQVNNVKILDQAVAGKNPVRPLVGMNMLAAAVLGLLVGCVGVIFWDYVDPTITGPEDIERLLKLNTVGAVPLVQDFGRTGEPGMLEALPAFSMPNSAVAESMRSIRTALQLTNRERPLRTLLISSCRALEGKTFVSCNLAAIQAMGGHRVLLVDADLRNPSVHGRLEMDNKEGLAEVLLGLRQVSEVVRPTGIQGLSVLTAGQQRRNPAELLELPRVRDFLAGLKYDYVIVDSSPVGMVSDGLVWASFVDGALLVVDTAQIQSGTLSHIIDSLRAANRHLLGAIVNKLKTSQTHWYGYYGYYYSEGDSPDEEGSVAEARNSKRS